MASIHHKFAVAAASVPLSLVLSASVNAASILGVSYEGDVIKIDQNTGVGTTIDSSGFFGLNSLADDSSGRFFSVTDPDASELLVGIEPETGSGSRVVNLLLGEGVSVRGLAFSPSDVLFAVTDNVLGNDQSELYTIDINTGIGTLIGSTEAGIQGLAFSPNGTLYGWNVGSVGLVTIDPLTGLATDINENVGGSANIQTIAFAPDGTLFGAHDSLFTIDPTTGISAVIGSGDYEDVRGIGFVLEDEPKSIPEPTSVLALLALLVGVKVTKVL